jgi:hypothetical protein
VVYSRLKVGNKKDADVPLRRDYQAAWIGEEVPSCDYARQVSEPTEESIRNFSLLQSGSK